MPTAAEQAYINAILAGASPEGISNYAGAIERGIPAEVAANPGAYHYDYGADPTGQGYLRDEAFAPVQNYDFRTDPSYLALTNGFQGEIDQSSLRSAHELGNLDVLQPVTEDDIRAKREQSLAAVDVNAESRGVYQSGERALTRASTAGDYERQLTGVALSGALQRGNVQFDQAQQLAEIERRRANALSQYANPPSPGAPPGG